MSNLPITYLNIYHRASETSRTSAHAYTCWLSVAVALGEVGAQLIWPLSLGIYSSFWTEILPNQVGCIYHDYSALIPRLSQVI